MIRRCGVFLLTLPAAAAFFVIPAEAQTSRGAAPSRGVSSAYEAQLPPGYWLDEEEDDVPVRRGYRRQLSQNPAPVGVPNRILPSSDEEADASPLPPPGLAPQDVRPPASYGHQFDQRGRDQDAVARPPAAVGAAPAAAPGAAAQPAPGAGNASVMTLPPEDQPETGQPKALPENLKKQLVDYQSNQPAGTLIVDTPNTYLYLVLGNGKALRYGIGVGREGFTWSGTERISRMKEWPDWFPPSEMIERQPYLPRMMAGGPGNPLGARALYLGNTLYRIHGTNQPSTIGQTVSSGCIRLLNEDIEDLYSRVQTGTRVVVLPGRPPQTMANTAAPPAAGMPTAAAIPPAPQGGPVSTGSGITSAPLPAAR
ncbi:L,D-transpeptidase [Microbacteriaceae bacterium K1510]|nr:L,D-transpeptidase [Microbacteriaceae bacterium K1510]